MPVAASSQQATDSPPVSARLRQFIPKPPGPGFSPESDPSSPQFPTPSHQDLQDLSLGAAAANSPGHDSLAEVRYFNTHSPPILNLSPNLSPSSEQQSTRSNLSPLCDWRETTRRRPSMQGRIFIFYFLVLMMLTPTHPTPSLSSAYVWSFTRLWPCYLFWHFIVDGHKISI